MRSSDILKDVFDTSEMDVPARDIPKDISSKEERKILRRTAAKREGKEPEKSTEDLRDLYSPNHFLDALYSPTQFQDDPVFHGENLEAVKDDGILFDANDASTRGIKPKNWDNKKNPSEVLLHMYTRAAACVSVLAISPREASLMMEEENFWGDLPNDDSQDYDEHHEQIQRLTSWNTLETAGTSTTNESESVGSASKKEEKGGSLGTRRKSKKSLPQRKRTVQFDYPIISSLKECPRPDPKDLPKLYFTEEELGQIEDDRESTYIADDVEVVCVSTSNSSEGARGEGAPQAPGTGGDNTAKDASGNSPRSKTARKGAPAPSAPEGKSPASAEGKASDTGRKRHIKSVQIYLRERSRERSPKS